MQLLLIKGSEIRAFVRLRTREIRSTTNFHEKLKLALVLFVTNGIWLKMARGGGLCVCFFADRRNELFVGRGGSGFGDFSSSVPPRSAVLGGAHLPGKKNFRRSMQFLHGGVSAWICV